MSLPLYDITVEAIETVFDLTAELKYSFTIVQNEDNTGGTFTFDPTTLSVDSSVPKKSNIVISDARILSFSEKKIRDSNGTLNTTSRLIIFRNSELGVEDISTIDEGTLPNGKKVIIQNVRYLVDEFNPVFIMMTVSGVN